MQEKNIKKLYPQGVEVKSLCHVNMRITAKYHTGDDKGEKKSTVWHIQTFNNVMIKR